MSLSPKMRAAYNELILKLLEKSKPARWVNLIYAALEEDRVIDFDSNNELTFKKFYRQWMQKMTEREERRARWQQAKAEQKEYVRLCEPEEPLFDKRKIVITGHARKRFIQRFVEGEVPIDIDEIIIDVLLQSKLYELSDVEKLRELILHKENAEHYSYKKCGFVVIRQGGMIVVLTVKLL